MIHQNTHWERRYLEKIHVHTVRTCDSGGAACPDKEREEKLALLLNSGHKNGITLKLGFYSAFPIAPLSARLERRWSSLGNLFTQ